MFPRISAQPTIAVSAPSLEQHSILAGKLVGPQIHREPAASGKIAYHSIIGDRGRGDSPNGSDRIVRYRVRIGQRLYGESVPIDHSATEQPEAVEEIRRILLEAIDEVFGGHPSVSPGTIASSKKIRV